LQFLLKKRAFLRIFANLCSFLRIFHRFFLSYLAHPPHINTPAPIFNLKTNIPKEMNPKNPKNPNFPSIPLLYFDHLSPIQ